MELAWFGREVFCLRARLFGGMGGTQTVVCGSDPFLEYSWHALPDAAGGPIVARTNAKGAIEVFRISPSGSTSRRITRFRIVESGTWIVQGIDQVRRGRIRLLLFSESSRDRSGPGVALVTLSRGGKVLSRRTVVRDRGTGIAGLSSFETALGGIYWQVPNIPRPSRNRAGIVAVGAI